LIIPQQNLLCCITSFESDHMSKVWFITGASTGFGYEMAAAVLDRGDRLVATARKPEQLAELVGRSPDNARAVQLDVTSPQHIRDAVELAMGEFGRIDVLINNAGYGLIGAVEEVSDEQINQNFATCLMGPLNLMRAILPIMRAQRSGHIINISAAAAINNYAGFGVYGAAKAALESLSESIALEAGPLGVKVTIVQPGPFRTDFISRSLVRGERRIDDYNATSGKFAELLEKVNGQQPGDPKKAAKAIVSLVDAERPPLRLVLGKYAHNKVRKLLRDTATELDAWESVGSATDR